MQAERIKHKSQPLKNNIQNMFKINELKYGTEQKSFFN